MTWCIPYSNIDDKTKTELACAGVATFDIPFKESCIVRYQYTKCNMCTENGTCVAIPFGICLKCNIINSIPPLRIPHVSNLRSELRGDQPQVIDEAKSTLTRGRSCVLVLPCGYGKTKTSTCLVEELCMESSSNNAPSNNAPTHPIKVVICNRVMLCKQWQNELIGFDGWLVTTPSKFERWSHLNFVCIIVDECHQNMSEKQIAMYKSFNTQFLIGLSATPWRPDHMTEYLTWFFGPHIVRHADVNVQVHVVHTNMIPPHQIAGNGRLDWNAVINWGAQCDERNHLIITHCINFLTTGNARILVLVKRINHGQALAAMCSEAGISVGTIMGSSTQYDASVDVLIGTLSKIGTGFNEPSRNTLILACDVITYLQQYIGRVTRSGRGHVLDLVDKSRISSSHFAIRKKVYRELGATIT
jgi:superfamily II DNA or RNA helicase